MELKQPAQPPEPCLAACGPVAERVSAVRGREDLWPAQKLPVLGGMISKVGTSPEGAALTLHACVGKGPALGAVKPKAESLAWWRESAQSAVLIMARRLEHLLQRPAVKRSAGMPYHRAPRGLSGAQASWARSCMNWEACCGEVEPAGLLLLPGGRQMVRHSEEALCVKRRTATGDREWGLSGGPSATCSCRVASGKLQAAPERRLLGQAISHSEPCAAAGKLQGAAAGAGTPHGRPAAQLAGSLSTCQPSAVWHGFSCGRQLLPCSWLQGICSQRPAAGLKEVHLARTSMAA